MPVQSRWVQFKNFSGYLARGGPRIDQPVNPAMHVDRAVYLAGQLEAGSWGTVQSYDGCGMSGGILHNISVSPKDLSQGDFFSLLFTVSSRATQAFAPIAAEFTRLGWKLTSDGKLRISATGALVPGAAIRLEFSGATGGNVPKAGPDSLRAKAWAERFYNLFSLPVTYAAQSDFASAWLSAGNSSDEHEMYFDFMGQPQPPPDSIIGIPVSRLPPEIELAMCVYHAFSVNAPGIAKAVLNPIVMSLRGQSNPDAAKTAAKLIRSLGTRRYGNWMDDPGDGSNRYDRTRLAVWARPDLWPAPMAKSLMPRDL